MREPDAAVDVIARLRAHLESALPREAVPEQFVFVDTFPLLPNGKVDRPALERRTTDVRPARPLPQPSVVARLGEDVITDDLDFLVRLFTSELSQAHIDPDEDLRRLGVTSLRLAKVCAAWTDRTGRHVDGVRLQRSPTIRNILAYSSPIGWSSDNAEVVVEDHRFVAPLDHDNPAGPSIMLFAQTVVRREAAARDLPYLLFLQGGPGGQCTDPRTKVPAWLDAALDRTRSSGMRKSCASGCCVSRAGRCSGRATAVPSP